MSQHGECLIVGGAWIADLMSEAPYGLDVLCEDVDFGIKHAFNVAHYPLEIRRQCLDGDGAIVSFDGANAGRIVCSAAVRQIIAIYRGQHNVSEAHQSDARRDIVGLTRIEPTPRIAG